MDQTRAGYGHVTAAIPTASPESGEAWDLYSPREGGEAAGRARPWARDGDRCASNSGNLGRLAGDSGGTAEGGHLRSVS